MNSKLGNMAAPSVQNADRAANSRLRRFNQTLCMIAIAAPMAGCEGQSPQAVCASPEAIAVVEDIIVENIIRYGDLSADELRKAYGDLALVDSIVFEGYNRETRKVSCKAQMLNRDTGSTFTINYTRQPTVDGRYNYELEYSEYSLRYFSAEVAGRARVNARRAVEEVEPRREHSVPPAPSNPDRPPEPSSATSTEPSERSSSSLPTSGRFRLPVDADDGSAPTSDDRVTSTN